MLHFVSSNLIFIEVPKTGTSSIVQECLKRSSELRRNRLFLNSNSFVDLPTHATSQEVRKLLNVNYRTDKIFAFMRDPVELLCSKYSFYRSGRAFSQFKDPSFKTTFRHKINVLLARSLPLLVYSIFVPYKSSSFFLLDTKGNLNVDLLFDYAMLDKACSLVFTDMFPIYEDFLLPHVNKSNSSSYLSSNFIKTVLSLIVRIRLPRDCSLWRQLRASNGVLRSGI